MFLLKQLLNPIFPRNLPAKIGQMNKGKEQVNFGLRLYEVRTAKGWTQKQLAELVERTQPTIAGWESMNRFPRTKETKVCLIPLVKFGIDPAYFWDADVKVWQIEPEQIGKGCRLLMQLAVE